MSTLLLTDERIRFCVIVSILGVTFRIYRDSRDILEFNHYVICTILSEDFITSFSSFDFLSIHPLHYLQIYSLLWIVESIVVL